MANKRKKEEEHLFSLDRKHYYSLATDPRNCKRQTENKNYKTKPKENIN